MKQSRFFHCFILYFSATLFSAPALKAQEFAGEVVTSIHYRPTEQPVDPRDLDRLMVVRTGQRLETNQLAATIDRLFRSGLYDDIQVDAEPARGGVSLTFITKPRRFIGHVGATGDIKDPPS